MKRKLSQGTLPFSSGKRTAQSPKRPPAVQIRSVSRRDKENTESIKSERSAFSKLMDSARMHAQVDSFWLYEEDSHWFWQWVPQESSNAKALGEYRCRWLHTISLRGNRGWGKTQVTLRTNVPPYSSPSWKPREPNTRLSMSLLKSCLQKAIRRGLMDVSLQLTTEIWCRDPLELIRRLQIISIEDSMFHPAQPVLAWLMMASASADYSFSSRHFYLVLSLVSDLCRCPFRERFPHKLPKLEVFSSILHSMRDGQTTASSPVDLPQEIFAKQRKEDISLGVHDLTSDDETKAEEVYSLDKGCSNSFVDMRLPLPTLVSCRVPSRDLVETLSPSHSVVLKALYARMEYGGMKFDMELLTKAMHLYALRFVMDEQTHYQGCREYTTGSFGNPKAMIRPQPKSVWEEEGYGQGSIVNGTAEANIWQEVPFQGLSSAFQSAHRHLWGKSLSSACNGFDDTMDIDTVHIPVYKTWLSTLCYYHRMSSFSYIPPQSRFDVDSIDANQVTKLPYFTNSLWKTFLAFGSHYYVSINDTIDAFGALDEKDIPLAGIDFHCSDILSDTLLQEESFLLRANTSSISQGSCGKGSMAVHKSGASHNNVPKMVVVQIEREPPSVPRTVNKVGNSKTMEDTAVSSTNGNDTPMEGNPSGTPDTTLSRYVHRLEKALYAQSYPRSLSPSPMLPSLSMSTISQLQALFSHARRGVSPSHSPPPHSISTKRFDSEQLQTIMWNLRSGVNFRIYLPADCTSIEETVTAASTVPLSASEFVRRVRQVLSVQKVSLFQAGLFHTTSSLSFPRRKDIGQPIAAKDDFVLIFALILQTLQTLSFDESLKTNNCVVSYVRSSRHTDTATFVSMVDRLLLCISGTSEREFQIFERLHAYWDAWSLRLVTNRF